MYKTKLIFHFDITMTDKFKYVVCACENFEFDITPFKRDVWSAFY